MRIPITRIAGGAALFALGGLGATALDLQPNRPVLQAARPAPIEVRTQVIHRTVRIVRHEKPKRPRTVATPAAAPPPTAAPAPPPRVTYAAAPPAPAGNVAPLRTRTSGARRPKPAVTPLRTRTSGAGRRGGEHDGEGGGRDD